MHKKIRNSNLEALRILSMILIIAHHYSCHGFMDVEIEASANLYVIKMLHLGGKLGVDLFILLSAYFMSKSQFTMQKLAKILGEVCFYCVSIYLLFRFFITPTRPLVFRDLLCSIFPIGFASYWFITNYILLMIISPILNAALENLSQKKQAQLLFLGFVFWSVIPVFTNITYALNNIAWFSYLYLIAGYIRNNAVGAHRSSCTHFGIAVISYALVVLSAVLSVFIGRHTNSAFFIKNSTRFSDMNSPLILIASTALLLGCITAAPHCNKIINFLASTMFGVYLIHDNFIAGPYIWNSVFHCRQFANAPHLMIHAVISIFSIFIFGVFVDLLRQCTVEKLWMLGIHKSERAIEKWRCAHKQIAY